MDILSSMDFRQEGRADEYGLLVCRHPVSAMGAFHLVAIEGDNFHQGAEPQLFFSRKAAAWNMGRVRPGSKNISAGS